MRAALCVLFLLGCEIEDEDTHRTPDCFISVPQETCTEEVEDGIRTTICRTRYVCGQCHASDGLTCWRYDVPLQCASRCSE